MKEFFFILNGLKAIGALSLDQNGLNPLMGIVYLISCHLLGVKKKVDMKLYMTFCIYFVYIVCKE